MQPRRRRWRWLALALLGLIGAALGLRFMLQPERMGALVLEQARRASGLQLAVSSPATLGIFPALRLQLLGLEARAVAGGPTLLRAERVDLDLPLAVLWGGELQTGDVEILTPEIDVDAVLAWLQQGTEIGPPSALRLPDFAARLRISDGQLRAAGTRLEALNVDMSPLRDGEQVELNSDFILLQDEQRRPLTLKLVATPRQREAGITIEALLLHLGQPNAAGSGAEVSGDIELFPPQRLRLALWLNLAQSWLLLPALPEALARLLEGPMSLSYDGPGDFSAEMQLERIGSEAELRLAGAPRALLAWIDDAAAAPLPPAAFSAKVPVLELDGVRIEGLQVELAPAADTDLEPAPAPAQTP